MKNLIILGIIAGVAFYYLEEKPKLEPEPDNKKKKIIIGSSLAGGTLLTGAVAGGMYFYRRRYLNKWIYLDDGEGTEYKPLPDDQSYEN